MSNAGQFVARSRARSVWRKFQQAEALIAGYGGTGRDGSSHIGVRYVEVRRPAGRNIGPFTVVEHDRWDRNHLRIGTTVAAANVPATAAGVKTALRRIREQEALVLDELDEEIAYLEDTLRQARKNRRDALREAFNKGHVVRLAEVKALADKSVGR